MNVRAVKIGLYICSPVSPFSSAYWHITGQWLGRPCSVLTVQKVWLGFKPRTPTRISSLSSRSVTQLNRRHRVRAPSRPYYFDQIASISQCQVLLFPVALPVRAGLITWTYRRDGRFAAMVRYGEGNMWRAAGTGWVHREWRKRDCEL
jgi:hypothetical protein